MFTSTLSRESGMMVLASSLHGEGLLDLNDRTWSLSLKQYVEHYNWVHIFVAKKQGVRYGNLPYVYMNREIGEGKFWVDFTQGIE